MEDAHQQHKPATGYPAAQPSYPTGPTATAYPYHAPPPPSYYPNPYPAHPPPLYDHRRATLLRRLIVAAVAVFIIIGSVSFIIWLVLRPHLPEFSVSSASVSALNVSSSSSQLTADWDFTISVRNPNKKMTVDYDTVEAAVVYRFSTLAETTLAPFYQGKGNFTTIRARFAAVGDYVDDRTVRDLNADRTDGNVEFGVRLFSWVRFRAGAWRTRRHPMRVWCEHVRIGFPSTGRGSLSGTPMECNVDL